MIFSQLYSFFSKLKFPLLLRPSRLATVLVQSPALSMRIISPANLCSELSGKMSTWKIFPDAGNKYRWEMADQQFQYEESNPSLLQQPPPSEPIPSMKDLLLQGYSEVRQKSYCAMDNGPMFRTGLGKSVGIKQSSISRALAILNDGDEQLNGTGSLADAVKEFGIPKAVSLTNSRNTTKIPCSTLQVGLKENGSDASYSSFQTGSGKLVTVSSAGLDRAKRLLGLKENCDPEFFDKVVNERDHQTSEEPLSWSNLCNAKLREGTAPNVPLCGGTRLYVSNVDFNCDAFEGESEGIIPEMVHCGSKPPPIKFHTAGGRSISVSSNALKRARTLLGNLETGDKLTEINAANSISSQYKVREDNCNSVNKENDTNTPAWQQMTAANATNSAKKFTSPLRSNLYQKQSNSRLGILGTGNNLINKFDEEANDCKMDPSNRIVSAKSFEGKSSRYPLADVSNRIDIAVTDKKLNFGEKRRLERSIVSPFKRPRISKFVTPFNGNHSITSNGPSPLAMKESSLTRRVSTRFPFQIDRLYLKKYIKDAPTCHSKVETLPHHIWRMNPKAAEKYMFDDGFGSYSVGAEALYHMLIQSGASVHYISKEWVTNHYKWIVWKLASYERCYPAKFLGKLLTVSNVLEELKYRYEREVNHGHRSAIKKILGGDAPSSTSMVLCVSSVSVVEVENQTNPSSGAEGGASEKIELTDGWYSIYALLDALLSKKLFAGKLFVGQKLRIYGAGFHGWLGPVSPLETVGTSLVLHMNGTYRAHWADRLGFCRNAGIPLAFTSIKSTGGIVPCTLVGILRVYPVLYRERLSDGGCIVRSERMEEKMLQLHQQKRSTVEEGVVSELSKDLYSNVDNYENDEGAKILKILETAAEPEMLMAGMSSEQLTSFASYKAKLEAMRQTDIERSIEKALVAAGLSNRQVTPFMRFKVIGLTSKSSEGKYIPRTGLITIWNPTEKQQLELQEGHAYAVSWLMPLSSDPSVLHLQGRGPSTTWLPLSPLATKHFEPFFSPRKPTLLSNLGEVPFSSEFDVAAFIIYVGDVYTTDRHKKQWVFLTDGSICQSLSSEPLESLLAVSFSIPFGESELSTPVNPAIAGSMVAFCNLLKKAKDQMNNLWVAEATENSTYSLSFDHREYSHLKDAAASAQKWANVSGHTIENLKRRVKLVISKAEG